MDRSSESGEIEISRRPPVMPPGYAGVETGVDVYFAAISKILADAKIEKDWERSVVHGYFVQVTIDIGERKSSSAPVLILEPISTAFPIPTEQTKGIAVRWRPS